MKNLFAKTKKVITTIAIATAAICFLGLFCEYHTEVYSHFVMYYVGLMLSIAFNIFVAWYIQDYKKSNKIIKAVVKDTVYYIHKYIRRFVAWLKYAIELTSAIIGFFYRCKKAHKSWSWTITKFIELAKS